MPSSCSACVPTIMAAVGEPDIKDKLMKGYSANGRDYKIHLDGYNFLQGRDQVSYRSIWEL